MNSFPTQSVINLDNIRRVPYSKYPNRKKKSGNVDSNPRSSACKADAQTKRPLAPADIPQSS